MSPLPDGRRHRPADFYHERTNFDFTGRSWRWAILSGTVIVIALVAIFTRGLNLGIDFEGGTSWQTPVNAVIQVLPEGVSERVSAAIENGQVKTWALGIGAAWLVVRLAEIRQLRKMNRQLIGSR